MKVLVRVLGGACIGLAVSLIGVGLLATAAITVLLIIGVNLLIAGATS